MRRHRDNGRAAPRGAWPEAQGWGDKKEEAVWINRKADLSQRLIALLPPPLWARRRMLGGTSDP